MEFTLVAKIGQGSEYMRETTKKILSGFYEVMEGQIKGLIGDEPYDLLHAVVSHYPKLEGFMLQGEDPEQPGIPEDVKKVLVSLQTAKEELFTKTAKTYDQWIQYLIDSVGRFEPELFTLYLENLKEKLGV